MSHRSQTRSCIKFVGHIGLRDLLHLKTKLFTNGLSEWNSFVSVELTVYTILLVSSNFLKSFIGCRQEVLNTVTFVDESKLSEVCILLINLSITLQHVSRHMIVFTFS